MSHSIENFPHRRLPSASGKHFWHKARFHIPTFDFLPSNAGDGDVIDDLRRSATPEIQPLIGVFWIA
jgi:hypothetical protein